MAALGAVFLAPPLEALTTLAGSSVTTNGDYFISTAPSAGAPVLSILGGSANVGIGTSNPVYSLQVVGGWYGSGQAIVGGTMTVQGGAFSVGGSTLIVTGGQVGIGTANPQATLDVGGSAAFGSGAAKSTFTATPGGATYALQLSSGVDLSAGPVVLSAGGFIRFADNTTQAAASSGGGAGLSSTQTWTGQNTFTSTVTFSDQLGALIGTGWQNYQKFTTSGTFTVPAGVYKIMAWLQGGGGGGAYDPILSKGSSGGGGGCFDILLATASPAQSIAITVGKSGAGGTSLVSASAGGATLMYGDSAGGGGVGSTGTYTVGGAGGVCSGAGLFFAGQAGGRNISNCGGNGGNAGFGGGAGVGVAPGAGCSSTPTNGTAADANSGSGGGGESGGGSISGNGGAGYAVIWW